MGRKIGLLGSAPSSIGLAPFADKSWEFWGCSPGCWATKPRTERWFELHVWEPGQPWFSPEYTQFLRDYPGQVFVSKAVPEIKNHVVYPLAEMQNKFGPYFWTSTVAYMFALAITEQPEEIGLWGVDMAAWPEEYGYQRAGCQYMAQIAHLRGIRVRVPPESDLLVPSPPYGFVENSHMYLKLRARMKELNAKAQDAEQRVQAATQEAHFFRGAIDDLHYVAQTWPGLAMAQLDPAASARALEPKGGNGEDRTAEAQEAARAAVRDEVALQITHGAA